MRLIVATSNPHKVDEIRNIAGGCGAEVELVALGELEEKVELPEEDGETFLENARKKALHVARVTGEAALADDSGLCVDALGGEPGVRSNRFLGEDSTPEERNEAILRLLGRIPDEQRGARFACAACIAFPDGRTLEALETCSGTIARRPSGTGGFGYDPIFYLPELGCTLAEVPQETKNSVSHRGKAVREVLRLLRERSGDASRDP